MPDKLQIIIEAKDAAGAVVKDLKRGFRATAEEVISASKAFQPFARAVEDARLRVVAAQERMEEVASRGATKMQRLQEDVARATEQAQARVTAAMGKSTAEQERAQAALTKTIETGATRIQRAEEDVATASEKASKAVVAAEEQMATASKQAATAMETAASHSQGFIGKLAMAAPALMAVGQVATQVGNEVTSFFMESINIAAKAAATMAQTEAVIKSTGGAAGFSARQFEEMADGLARVTAVSPEMIADSQNLLQTFTQVKGDVFKQAEVAILDMSRAMKIDLHHATILVGKALNDLHVTGDGTVRGFSALRRVGVQVSDSMMAQAAAAVKAGDTQRAQMLMVKELMTEFGGSAEAFAKTGAGQMELYRINIELLQKAIGTGLLPTVTSFMQAVTPLVSVLGEFAKTSPGKVLIEFAFGLGLAAKMLGPVLGLLAQYLLQKSLLAGVSAIATDALGVEAGAIGTAGAATEIATVKTGLFASMIARLGGIGSKVGSVFAGVRTGIAAFGEGLVGLIGPGGLIALVVVAIAGLALELWNLGKRFGEMRRAIGEAKAAKAATHEAFVAAGAKGEGIGEAITLTRKPGRKSAAVTTMAGAGPVPPTTGMAMPATKPSFIGASMAGGAMPSIAGPAVEAATVASDFFDQPQSAMAGALDDTREWVAETNAATKQVLAGVPETIGQRMTSIQAALQVGTQNTLDGFVGSLKSFLAPVQETMVSAQRAASVVMPGGGMSASGPEERQARAASNDDWRSFGAQAAASFKDVFGVTLQSLEDGINTAANMMNLTPTMIPALAGAPGALINQPQPAAQITGDRYKTMIEIDTFGSGLDIANRLPYGRVKY